MRINLTNIEYEIDSITFRIFRMNEAFRDRKVDFKSSIDWSVRSVDCPEINTSSRIIFLRGSNGSNDMRNGIVRPLNQNKVNEIILSLEEWDKNWHGNLRPRKTEDILETWI